MAWLYQRIPGLRDIEVNHYIAHLQVHFFLQPMGIFFRFTCIYLHGDKIVSAEHYKDPAT